MNQHDHEQLHDWVARAALAGAAVSVLELLLAAAGGGPVRPLVEALRVALLVAVVVPPRQVLDGVGLFLLGVGGAAAASLPVRLGLPMSALLVGVGWLRGLDHPRPGRRLEVLGIGATAALAALVVRRALIETGVLSPILGPGVGAAMAGAIAGAVTGLGAIGRLLGASAEVARPAAAELERLASEVTVANAEVGGLLRRAAEAHRQAAEVVSGLTQTAEAPAAKTAADDLIERMVRFGREWMEVERRATATRPEALTERVALLETRLDKSEDPVAKAELARAIQAVRAQGEALAEILRGRERAVARLEHQVATLERLRLAALRHRSADAGRLQAELQPVLDELAEAGGDYDLASDALRDADEESQALVPVTPRPN